MSKSLISKVKRESEKLYPKVVEWRRHLHAYPELSFKEYNTSQYVSQLLTEAGIKHKKGYCKTGIVAEIKGELKGDITYLRGDMDALPIQEENTCDYKSTVNGVMHACGHDVHTSCVLGAAHILSQLKSKLRGTVRIVFQPGEERLPGGASIMIKEGAIKNSRSAAIYGQHVHPPLEVGKVGFCPGQYMASADELYFTIVGRGGHAALPQDCIDTILVASEVVTALHQIVARYSDPKVPTVLSVGKIWSDGGATNVIPDKVHMEGTFRTMDEKNRAHIHQVIKRTISNICKAYGAKSKVKIMKGYPSLFNDESLTKDAIEIAKSYMGKDNVVMLDQRMTAEDFSFYSQMMPACFYRLGTGNVSKNIVSPVHTPTFDIDEEALLPGVGLMAFLALTRG